ncbi:MAG: cyclase family protein [candidate division KSB1 bacterium]|nr:cyclase family protein [candidate division KSB1 bacterium]
MLVRFGALIVGLLTVGHLGCDGGQGRYADLFSGKLIYEDLSYPLDRYSLIWPGYKADAIQIDTVKTIARDGVLLMRYHFSEHLGTHLDAPNHLFAGAPSGTQTELKSFFANAVVIDIANQCSKNPDYLLQKRDIEIWEEIYRPIPDHTLVFVYTGWGSYWGNAKKYFGFDRKKNMHFPGVSPEAVEFLLNQRQIVGMGIDVALIEGGRRNEMIVHRALLQRGKLLLENVANLDRVPARNAKVIIAPLKVSGSSGSPVRIFAILP